MRFTQLLSMTAVAIFASIPSAVADDHTSCTCHNQDSYNWRITTAACDLYNNWNNDNNAVAYDSPSGRCNTIDANQVIDGKNWENACQETAKAGFQCTSGQGTCYVEDTSNVQGWCK
ncbi:hypothetical protein K490DRAFT_54751 [Saccharata proteae CBS 121410]|uniref:Uncharacterized protein n=1 Tax=Saccharata proteae CBS 121410 TaxID=1314787 RepID=A0A9P4HWB0_9PEZI|nr:hypothetical protein K490DRAFT_54751 [Saccharata proteae CBS 121410]